MSGERGHLYHGASKRRDVIVWQWQALRSMKGLAQHHLAEATLQMQASSWLATLHPSVTRGKGKLALAPLTDASSGSEWRQYRGMVLKLRANASGNHAMGAAIITLTSQSAFSSW